MIPNDEIKLAIIGLGYVGLPLAAEFGKKRDVIGFDINKERIESLQNFVDSTLELSDKELHDSTGLTPTSDPALLANCNCFIISVPTPVDEMKQPDLSPLISASSLVGRTVIFDQAAMRNVTAFGNTGTGGATFTFNATDENFVDRIQASGQPKSFQIYNGDTTESDFNLLTSGGDTVQLLNVQPGALIPLAVIRVWAAGTDTTAGTIVALT